MKRTDDFESRRAHLKDMTDEQLKAHFWTLATRLTDPLVELGKTYTSPSIERSVLLRMGFSSIEAKAIVDIALEKNLCGHGVGHVVYKLAKTKGMDVRAAGLALSEGKLWDDAVSLFEEVRA